MMRADAEEDYVGNMSNGGMSVYAVVAGILMLILVGIVHFTGILPE